MNTCLYVVINTDTRFVVPNRGIRIGERSAAARPRATELRATSTTIDHFCSRLPVGELDHRRTVGPVDITSSSDPVWFIESAQGCALVTSEIEAPRLVGDFDLDALGWDLITVPWFDADGTASCRRPPSPVSADWLLTDRPDVGLNVSDEIVAESNGIERTRACGPAVPGRAHRDCA
jgi:hypothetical protein